MHARSFPLLVRCCSNEEEAIEAYIADPDLLSKSAAEASQDGTEHDDFPANRGEESKIRPPIARQYVKALFLLSSHYLRLERTKLLWPCVPGTMEPQRGNSGCGESPHSLLPELPQHWRKKRRSLRATTHKLSPWLRHESGSADCTLQQDENLPGQDITAVASLSQPVTQSQVSSRTEAEANHDQPSQASGGQAVALSNPEECSSPASASDAYEQKQLEKDHGGNSGDRDGGSQPGDSSDRCQAENEAAFCKAEPSEPRGTLLARLQPGIAVSERPRRRAALGVQLLLKAMNEPHSRQEGDLPRRQRRHKRPPSESANQPLERTLLDGNGNDNDRATPPRRKPSLGEQPTNLPLNACLRYWQRL